MNINQLSKNILEIHKQFQQKAVSAINISLTLRNWWIGAYIVEFEQNGEDRAKYGSKLLFHLSKKINIKGLSVTNLRVSRQFYSVYPYIYDAIKTQDLQIAIHQTVSDELQKSNKQEIVIHQTASDELRTLKNIENRIKNSTNRNLRVPPQKIISKLSFSHLTELIKIENSLKRVFYEVECINGTWSLSELKRQINSLYYERSGLSENKEKLSVLANENADTLSPADIIKNPMTFEFLNLPVKYLLEEQELEKALIDNMQQFLLELGNGFCFEARQKRILIDDEYFFVDLVFYHRILNCHVLIEIKTEEFTHENIGQLNVYLQYYKHEIMRKTDNPPVGILLCTKSKKNMVKYATAADKQLFVSEYRLNLPSEKEIQDYIKTKI